MPKKVLCAWVLGIGVSAAALAQPVPLSPLLRFGGLPVTALYRPSVGSRSDGGFVAVWTSYTFSSFSEPVVLAQRFDAAGVALGDISQLNTKPVSDYAAATVAVDPAGDFMTVWHDRETGKVLARFCDASGVPRGAEIEISPGISLYGSMPPFSAVALGDGRFAVAWEDRNGNGVSRRLFVRRYDRSGLPLGPAELIRAVGWPQQFGPAVARQGDGFAVAWQVARVDDLAYAGQRFGGDGSRLGEVFEIASAGNGNPAWYSTIALATAPDGGLLAVWNNNLGLIAGRRYGPGGASLGAPFLITADFLDIRLQPSVAFEPGGKALVVWYSQSGRRGLNAQVLDARGLPTGPQFYLSSTFDPEAAVAGLPNGDFAVLWQQYDDDPDVQAEQIFGRKLRIPPLGDEPCLLPAAGRLTCDTLRTGAGLLQRTRPLHPGDVPLVGDVDGSRQDDFCFYRAGVFVCDTRHEAGVATQIAFGGQPGDTPLLGDLNGDGRDDPCVRRVRRFLCDTAHDGGFGEVQVIFGLRGDTPLLGDLDGDGDDDACVVRGGHFLCDTAHDGGNPEFDVAFGAPGDVPLLGDVNADGRDDPCVFRGGLFLCDTAHDGGTAEVEMTFLGSPGAVPLLGNLDGF